MCSSKYCVPRDELYVLSKVWVCVENKETGETIT